MNVDNNERSRSGLAVASASATDADGSIGWTEVIAWFFFDRL